MKLSNRTVADTLVWIYITQSTKFQRRKTLLVLSSCYAVTPNGAIVLTERGLRLLNGGLGSMEKTWYVYDSLIKMGYELFSKPSNRDLIVFVNHNLSTDDPNSTLIFREGETLYDKVGVTKIAKLRAEIQNVERRQ